MRVGVPELCSLAVNRGYRIMSEAKISKVVKVGYGFVEIGTNTLIVFASFYFLFYMTEALRIPPVYAGLLFFIAKIFDVITDPLVGNLSDRSSTPMGRRRPFMLAGGIMLGPTVAIMFLAPFVGSESWVPSALYFMVFTIATYLALTLIAVPGGAVTAEMTEDYNERITLPRGAGAWVLLACSSVARWRP